MNQAIIVVGSNIDPEQNTKRAKELIQKGQLLLGESSFVRTKPIGNINQPDFINGALLIATELGLPELTSWLKTLERKLGRVKTADTYSPRTIDLDVIVWNGNVINKDFYERDFVRNAVFELLPDVK